MQNIRSSLKINANKLRCLYNGVIKSCVSTSATKFNRRPPGEDTDDLMQSYTHDTLSYTTTVSKYPIVVETIYDQIARCAKEAPKKLVYAFPHQRIQLTFLELQQRVDTIAQNLLNLGFQKGDRIAFVLPNNHEFVTTYLAASKIGLISVALNPAYQVVEFEYMLKKTGCKGIIMYDSFKILNHMEVIRKICPEIDSSEAGNLKSSKLPNLKHVIIINSPLVEKKSHYNGTIPFEKIGNAQSVSLNHELPYVESDDSCLILFTSGTTGVPKGALMTQANLLNSAYLSTVTVGNPDGLRMLCNPIPMFHIFGLSTGILIPLLMCSSIVFPFYFPDTLASLKAIQGYKCNTMRGTPTQFVDLLNHPERKNHDISTLKNCILGGSSVPPELVVNLKKDLGIKSIIIGYGMTETSLCHSVVTSGDEKKGFKIAYESVGRTVPYSESKVVDINTGRIQPHNTEGELCVRGPHIIKSYWDEPEKTAETIRNGWLHTGDVLTMDADGVLYFKSRHKDIIIRGGANIYPAEVESYLCTHPSVADAHVFGVPDERLQEEICAWIKLKPDAKLTVDEVKDYCKNNISHFKIPRYIKFVDKFPINANNKVLKTVMREQAKNELKL